jgi:flagellar assembly factor FliW
VSVIDAPAPAAGPVLAVTALALVEPMPGFPGFRDYALVAADGQGLVRWLQAVDPEGPRFLVVPAAAFFPDYAPALPRAVHAELGLDDAERPDLYCIVTVPGGDVGAATANLRAPLAVNVGHGVARQVVLPDGHHPIRRPLRR